MLPKEILFKTLRHEACDYVAWVPFAGVHAGSLIGVDAETVLKDGNALYKSLIKVNELYKPCGQPVIFDLQLEAECLGCKLLWSKDSPPSVSSHPLEDDMSVPCMIPTKESGRIPMVLDVMKRMKTAVGATTALYGLICGPFTLASHLRGNDIFVDMFDDEDYVEKLLDYCADVACAMSDMFIDAGMDVIAVVDPLISQISSDHFQQFMTTVFSKVFTHIHNRGVLSSFFVCGDATRNIEVMCKTKPDSISVDENVNIAAAKKICDNYKIAIGGNIPLTTVMLHGTQQDNMKCVIDILDTIDDRRGFILAPGCDMPYAVPIENVIGAAQAVLQENETRAMLENYVAVSEDIPVELPDYSQLKKPFVEVFTLDSATCAACTYMMGAAHVAKDAFGDKIDVIEYKYTSKENIARCKKMGVPNLPSMYINGQLKFKSIIPDKTELHRLIEESIEIMKR